MSLATSYTWLAPLYDRVVEAASRNARRTSLAALPRTPSEILLCGVGTGLDLPLEEWLFAHTFPLEARYADLAFAASVWPAAKGVLRRLIELMLAVIVSKLVISIAGSPVCARALTIAILSAVGTMRVHHDVERALAVQQHFTRAVPRHRPEAHQLEHLAQCLRARGGVLDELDAVQAQRVGGPGRCFAADGGGVHAEILRRSTRAVPVDRRPTRDNRAHCAFIAPIEG